MHCYQSLLHYRQVITLSACSIFYLFFLNGEMATLMIVIKLKAIITLSAVITFVVIITLLAVMLVVIIA